MLDFLALGIYLGGVFTYPDIKRGFWKRVNWPIELGEELYRWVLKQRGQA